MHHTPGITRGIGRQQRAEYQKTVPRQAAEDESVSNEPVQRNLFVSPSRGRASGIGHDCDPEARRFAFETRKALDEGGRSGAGDGGEDKNQNAQKSRPGKAA
jgi:hypothetical protein